VRAFFVSAINDCVYNTVQTTTSTTTTSRASTTTTSTVAPATTSTTLPLLGPAKLLEFPQIAAGGGYCSILYLFNPSALAAKAQVELKSSVLLQDKIL
jgi:hypothetical protein